MIVTARSTASPIRPLLCMVVVVAFVLRCFSLFSVVGVFDGPANQIQIRSPPTLTTYSADTLSNASFAVCIGVRFGMARSFYTNRWVSLAAGLLCMFVAGTIYLVTEHRPLALNPVIDNPFIDAL